MKKILIVAAGAGLISLAACNAPNSNTAAENAVDSHEANAALYDDLKDNATNATVESTMDNASAKEENAAEAAENGY